MNYLALFLMAASLDAMWVLAVRFVRSKSRMALTLTAMLMAAVSYSSTLVLVDDHWVMLAGIAGAGAGVLAASFAPSGWFDD